MKLASKNDSIRGSKMPVAYLNNPHIMRIVNDSFGNLNQKFNRGQVLETGFPMENCHFKLSGMDFVPVAMDISIEPQRVKKHDNSFNSYQTNISRQRPQSALQMAKNNHGSVGLMPLPVPTQNRDQQFTSTFRTNGATNMYAYTPMESVKSLKTNDEVDNGINKNKNYQVKTIFCTGTIERLLRWHRNLEDVFCMYETIASIVSLQEGRVKNQKIMLLRDKKGPILQVQYYASTHIDINDFYIGQYLRCVGRMIGFNILSAESIREAKEIEISTLARLSYVCDYSVKHNLNTA